jgi:hypothetical protein
MDADDGSYKALDESADKYPIGKNRDEWKASQPSRRVWVGLGFQLLWFGRNRFLEAAQSLVEPGQVLVESCARRELIFQA